MSEKIIQAREILAQWEHQLSIGDLAQFMNISETEAREIVASMSPDYRIHNDWALLTDNGLDKLLHSPVRTRKKSL